MPTHTYLLVRNDLKCGRTNEIVRILIIMWLFLTLANLFLPIFLSEYVTLMLLSLGADGVDNYA